MQILVSTALIVSFQMVVYIYGRRIEQEQEK